MADQSRATALGARGTPFIVIDQKYSFSSARGSQELLDLLNKLWRETHVADRSPIRQSSFPATPEHGTDALEAGDGKRFIGEESKQLESRRALPVSTGYNRVPPDTVA
ncbi:hypothetical protein QD460_26030 [Rhizobium jaguaris]|uniref:hypothetical protein n=1 Tax=Rhizobium jaguaris TaxID=1312183 RepID=UPI0039BF9068